jgi:hypothetical protein
MFNKTLLAGIALAMVLAVASPPKANAGVAIGVTVGAPVYARPVYPYYPYAVVRPVTRPVYVYPRPYFCPRPVVYRPVYDRPYWRHERWERHEYYEHRGWDRDHRDRW